MKWGTRYNAEYVNKLYRGITRHTTKKIDFYCFTDDPTDLQKEINVIKLKENWKGWWGKATLFSQGLFIINFFIILNQQLFFFIGFYKYK